MPSPGATSSKKPSQPVLPCQAVASVCLSGYNSVHTSGTLIQPPRPFPILLSWALPATDEHFIWCMFVPVETPSPVKWTTKTNQGAQNADRI